MPEARLVAICQNLFSVDKQFNLEDNDKQPTRLKGGNRECI